MTELYDGNSGQYGQFYTPELTGNTSGEMFSSQVIVSVRFRVSVSRRDFPVAVVSTNRGES